MRFFAYRLGFLALFGSMIVTVWAEPAKDTALAEKTRNIKLKTKITLEVKNEMLRDVVKEISGALEDKKVGSLSFRQDNGVNMNARLTVQIKDKAVEEILDDICKQLNYGYYIVSKEKDREDGFIRFDTNPKHRGYQSDEGTPTKEDDKKKEPMKKKEEKKETKKDANKEEARAKGRLGLAESYISLKMNEKAKMILEEIIKTYPDTKAAEEAKVLLEKLKK